MARQSSGLAPRRLSANGVSGATGVVASRRLAELFAVEHHNRRAGHGALEMTFEQSVGFALGARDLQQLGELA